MTLPLRRKHQITVRSTLATARNTPAVFAVALMLWPAVSARADRWRAEDDSAQQPEVVTVRCTVGRQGHKLKWLPYRPSKPRADKAVVKAQHLTTVPPATGNWTGRRSGSSPFNNPFRDSQAGPAAVAQLKTLAAEVPVPAKEEPLPARVFDPPVSSSLDKVRGGASGADSGIGYQSAERARSERPAAVGVACPSPEEGEYFTPIRELTTNTDPKPAEEGRAQEFPKDCPLGQEDFVPRRWEPITFTWKATGLCHKPLYFEDVHLERYGHSWGPYLQPVFSGAHFFLNVPILPYKMGLYPPHECIYTLGFYRPGSCAPYMLDPLPISVRAAMAQAGAWVGAAYVMP